RLEPRPDRDRRHLCSAPQCGDAAGEYWSDVPAQSDRRWRGQREIGRDRVPGIAEVRREHERWQEKSAYAQRVRVAGAEMCELDRLEDRTFYTFECPLREPVGLHAEENRVRRARARIVDMERDSGRLAIVRDGLQPVVDEERGSRRGRRIQSDDRQAIRRLYIGRQREAVPHVAGDGG